MAVSLLDQFQGVASANATAPKRRRLKSSPSAEASQELAQNSEQMPKFDLIHHRVTYRYTLGDVIRTRRQANGISAQKCSRRVIHKLLPHTQDLDIENCMFVIAEQLVDKLQPVPAMPVALRKVLQTCASARESICRDILKCDMTTGKHVLTAVVNGATIPSRWSDNEFLITLQKAALFLRWMACSLLPDVYAACKEDDARKFPEASVFFFLWSAIEDYILESWLRFVPMQSSEHVSLHYDGIRVHLPPIIDVDDFCKECASHIARETGFVVRIRPKYHMDFLALVKCRATSTATLPGIDAVFLAHGNCIPAAVMHLVGDNIRIGRMLKDSSLHRNVDAEARRVRSYAHVKDDTQIGLIPILGPAFDDKGLPYSCRGQR